MIDQQTVYGLAVDLNTRCLHYSSPVDIVAIKFKCCGCYYACFACHEASADHPAISWSEKDAMVKAVLCGGCGQELTVAQYLSCQSICPFCRASFNDRCRLHWPLYFSSGS